MKHTKKSTIIIWELKTESLRRNGNANGTLAYLGLKKRKTAI